jgi:hypothetical protein
MREVNIKPLIWAAWKSFNFLRVVKAKFLMMLERIVLVPLNAQQV